MYNHNPALNESDRDGTVAQHSKDGMRASAGADDYWFGILAVLLATKDRLNRWEKLEKWNWHPVVLGSIGFKDVKRAIVP